MMQALITKTMFIFYRLAYEISYTFDLVCFSFEYYDVDKAEITTNWLLAKR